MHKPYIIRAVFMLVTLFSYSVSAQTSQQNAIDSLRKVIPAQQGKEKAESYFILNTHVFSTPELQDYTDFYNEFQAFIQQELKKEKDTALIRYWRDASMECKYSYVTVLLNHGKHEEVIKNARSAIDYCRENDDINRYWYYKHYSRLFYALTLMRDHETLMDETRKTYDEAKERNEKYGMYTVTEALAIYYRIQGRHSDAEDYCRQTIDLAEDMPDKKMYPGIIYVYQGLITALLSQDKYDEAKQVFPKYEETVVKHEKIREEKSQKIILLERFYLKRLRQ